MPEDIIKDQIKPHKILAVPWDGDGTLRSNESTSVGYIFDLSDNDFAIELRVRINALHSDASTPHKMG